MSEFRRVHRATPLLQFWTTILAVCALVIANISGTVLKDIAAAVQHGHVKSMWFLLGIAGFLALCGAIWLVSGLWWRAMGYRLGAEEISLKHGVISKSLRTARYDRIQAVDVVEPVIARIFGVAKVRVETAGGNNSVLQIMYLRKAEAEQVRAEVLARRSGKAGAEPVGERPKAELSDAESDALIPPIPIKRSLLAAALSWHTLVLVLLLLPGLAGKTFLGIMLPVIVGVLPALWRIVDNSWEFTARVDGDVLHVSYGLADRRRQSIPVGRIHGVIVSQPWMWRWLGLWSVQVTVAGYGMEKANAGTSMLLPVGTYKQAMALLEIITPLTRAELVDKANPQGRGAAQFTSPARAKWLSPVDLRQQGTTLIDDRAVVIHSGRWGHVMKVIAPSHIQELTLLQGPIGHVLRVASVRLDLVQGPVLMQASELDREDAQRLVQQLRQRKFNSLNI
ncbi:PH domain-containing protein [Staphylococcus chromogenes]|nr:PH domain-containing protein [Staphylococcus chromogenes]